MMSISQPAEAGIPATQEEAWIAEAAYYRAERRGFQDGCPIEDWLAAERDIRQTTAPAAPVPRVALVFLDRRPVLAAD